jgi:multiple sugar transport system ATP-binding protein
MNLARVPLAGEYALFAETRVKLAASVLDAARRVGLSELLLGLRPEAFERASEGRGLKLMVHAVEALGADAFVHGEVLLASGPVTLIVRTEGRAEPPARGQPLWLEVHAAEAHAFHPESGVRLG